MSCLCFWASDPLIERIYWYLSIKGSEAQKHRPHKLLWMLQFDKKVYLISVVGERHLKERKGESKSGNVCIIDICNMLEFFYKRVNDDVPSLSHTDLHLRECPIVMELVNRTDQHEKWSDDCNLNIGFFFLFKNIKFLHFHYFERSSNFSVKETVACNYFSRVHECCFCVKWWWIWSIERDTTRCSSSVSFSPYFLWVRAIVRCPLLLTRSKIELKVHTFIEMNKQMDFYWWVLVPTSQ